MRNEIIAYERRVWDALVTGNASADTALLHPNFIGVYADGFAGRDDHVGQLADGPTIASYSLSDVTTKTLGQDHILICYHATFQRIGQTAPEGMYVSSIWQKQGQDWINIFSQDTAPNYSAIQPAIDLGNCAGP